MDHIRIFISSPDDVQQEREQARRVVERLEREFSYHVRLTPVIWEREPLRATEHFQEGMPAPRASDIVVVVLWGRLGTTLPPEQFKGALSGGPVTGTEWEFEDAMAAWRIQGRPHLLVYRKSKPVSALLEDDAALDEKRRQKRLVDEFFSRWFRSGDGTFLAAYHRFETEDDFAEKIYLHLKALLRQRLDPNAEAALPPERRWLRGSPFRALETFELEHAPVFFGRSRAQIELRQTLAERAGAGSAFILVFGASGSGKSSLVKAGLLADLKTPGMMPRLGLCRHAVVRPSALAQGGLLNGLTSALLAEPALPELARTYDAGALAEFLDHNRDTPRQIRVVLRAALAEAGRAAHLTELAEAKLALVVDQLEELFTTKSIDAEQSARFVDVLAALAQTDQVYVVATMRSDFFAALESSPKLARISEGGGRYLLTPPSPEELGQIIERPASEAGLQFEVNSAGISLADRIREEARNRAALPLVEYLLDQLWQQRSETGTLTWSAYERLKGLKGAIGVRAEQVLAALPEPVQAALPRVIRSLVQLDADGTATARRVPRDDFAAQSNERVLIEALLAPSARLLVAEAAAGTAATIRLAHEALLTHWPAAKHIIEQNREFLAARDRAERAAAIWRRDGEAADRLLPPRTKALAEADELLKRRDELGGETVRFIERSRDAAIEHERLALAQAQRRARRFRALAGVAGLLAVVAIGGGIYAAALERQAERQRQEAVAQREIATKSEVVARQRLAETLLAQARILSKSAVEAAGRGDSELGQLLLLALHREVLAPNKIGLEESDILRSLHSILRSDRLMTVLSGHTKTIHHAAFDTALGGAILTASSDGTARLWNAETGAQIASFEGHIGPVRFAAFGGGEKIVTASDDTTARVWNWSGTEAAVLKGHTRPLATARFSPDAARVVTASEDRTARVWASDDGRELFVMRGHTGGVRTAAFSGDGQRIVTASSDTTARVWSAEDGRELAVLRGHTKAVVSAAFSPDGTRIVTASADETARIWDAETGRELAVLAGHTRIVVSADFNSDGDRIVTAAHDGTAKIWDAGSGREISTLRGHLDAVLFAVFSEDGQRVLTGSLDRTARVWDAKSGRELTAFRGHGDAVRAAAFSPDGQRVVTAEDQTARIWDSAGDRQKALLKGHQRVVRWALFDEAGRRVATGSSDHTVRVSDTDGGKELAVLRGHTADARPAAFSKDGARLLTVSVDTTGRIWDIGSGAVVAELKGHSDAVGAATFSPDGRRVVTASRDKTARVWDAATGKALAVLSGHTNEVTSAVFSADGQRILTASTDWTVRVWDSASGRQLMVMYGHTQAVLAAAFSEDQARIVSVGDDKTARIWDSANGKPLVTLQGHSEAVLAAAFSPDQRQMVTASHDGTARVWDAGTGRELRVLRGHASRVRSADFSKDGRRIVTSSTDGTVRVWDGASARELAIFDVPQKEILRVAVIAGGQRVLIAAADGSTVQILDEAFVADFEEALRYLEWRAYRNLTDGERETYNLPARQVPDARAPGDDCDALGGDAFDPKGRTRVEVDVKDRWAKAVDRCRREFAANPSELRLRYQLGRALYFEYKMEESVEHVRAAADGGYPSAIFWLGLFNAWGSGMERDDAAAARLFQRAFDAGVPLAGVYLGYVYQDGLGVEADEDRALELLQQGADRGIPQAHDRLAQHYIAQYSGDAVEKTPDAASALLHYSLAAKLYTAVGYTAAATRALTTRANLARSTNIENVLDAIARAEAWKPKADAAR